MFTEAERVKVRRWLGYPPLFLQQNPRLESAMTAVQSEADGGARPDDASEVAIRGYLAKLDTYEARWLDMLEAFEASKTDELVTDHVRAQLAIQQVMRIYIGHISDALNTPPARDVLSPASPIQ